MVSRSVSDIATTALAVSLMLPGMLKLARQRNEGTCSCFKSRREQIEEGRLPPPKINTVTGNFIPRCSF
jgi:hypothetical protein